MLLILHQSVVVPEQWIPPVAYFLAPEGIECALREHNRIVPFLLFIAFFVAFLVAPAQVNGQIGVTEVFGAVERDAHMGPLARLVPVHAGEISVEHFHFHDGAFRPLLGQDREQVQFPGRGHEHIQQHQCDQFEHQFQMEV